MVRQAWYQVKGTLRTGPPPKYIIPDKQLFNETFRCNFCSLSFQKVSDVGRGWGGTMIIYLTPGWCDDSSHWPASVVLLSSWHCPNLHGQKLEEEKSGFSNQHCSLFKRYNLVFVPIASAVHHCSQHYFSWINSWWVEPGSGFWGIKRIDSSLNLMQMENSGKSVVSEFFTHLR